MYQKIKAVRGAITVSADEREEILSSSAELLDEMLKRNGIRKSDVVSIVFTATRDLTRAYPAEAARAMGLKSAALICCQEMYVEGSLEKCVRVMMNIYPRRRKEIFHTYLRGASVLRPDLPGKIKENKKFNVAIDGPSGSGKSTAAKTAANKLGFIYVDTGAMYRSVALYGLNNGYDLNSKEDIEAFTDKALIDLKYIDGSQRIFLNGSDVTETVRGREVADGSSKVAVVDKVRAVLTKMQREIAASNNVIMDGRDIATDVLPYAQVKIYMDADTRTRAERRKAELEARGTAADLSSIVREIEERDFRDKNRESSPLRQHPDAVFLDTSRMTAAEAAEAVLEIVRRHLG